MKPAPAFAAHHRKSDGEWQSLDDHLIGVAALSKRFAAKLGLQQAGELLGLLHDLGKYSQAFQTYLKSATGEINQDEDEDWVDAVSLKGKIDHSTAGAQMIWEKLSAKGQKERLVAQLLALCIASHHSGLIDCLTSDATSTGNDNFGRRIGKGREKTHVEEALGHWDEQVRERASTLFSNPRLTDDLFARIARVWKRDLEPNMPPYKSTIGQFKVGLVVRLLFSCLIDADRINTADFERGRSGTARPGGAYTSWGVLIDRLERRLAAWVPTERIDLLRQDISLHCRDAASRGSGVFTLTVPTGGGKTLASLRFALHHALQRTLDRVIYVIPFTTIIDQNAKVVRSVLEPADAPADRGNIVLEHHSNLTPEQQGWREKMLCENWDAPVVYTTMVQFLDTLFGSGTRGARRMHQLANAVLVFDEVQTLPIRCVHMFNNAVNFLVEQCNCTVLLCTATQPLLHRVDDVKGAIRLHAQHEVIGNVEQLFRDLKRVEIKNLCTAAGWSFAEIAALALKEVSFAQSCLVVVNTKSAARSIYELCAGQPDVPTFHLSTNMCPAHRKDILAKVTARLADQRPVLCISTQLIEAGIDVDFGSVIRSMAGLDSIAQAAGRCNRNGRRSSGSVHIVNPSDERLTMLPDIAIGKQKAEQVLADYADAPSRFDNDPIGPKAIDSYYENYFWTRRDQMDYPETSDALGHTDTLLSLLSANAQVTSEYMRRNRTEPHMYLRQSYMAAARAFKVIDAPTQGVIVPYGSKGQALVSDLCAAYDVELEIKLLRRAQQYTVNVFPNVMDELVRAGALYEIKKGTRIWCLDERYYGEEFGIATEPVAKMRSMYADDATKQH
ncbi:MAG: CRISPR-associated protein [Methylibium sp. NZG]|nr:MAG: CRISPR-associated protein [Methylibium sp. NZG]